MRIEDFYPSVGFRHQCDRVDDTERQPFHSRPVGKLEKAAGIGCSDNIATCRANVFELARQEFVGHGGLNQVIYPRASTTPGALGKFD